MLNWLRRFDTFCFLDNQSYPEGFGGCLLGAGLRREFSAQVDRPALADLETFLKAKDTWYFGHLSYDLKNEISGLSSNHPDRIGFPLVYFFEPEILVRWDEELEIHASQPESVFEEIEACEDDIPLSKTGGKVQQALGKEEYIGIIHKLKQHIHRGDCYEINFCQEFFMEEAGISPEAVFARLCELSPNPFSAFYRVRDKWLLCASPERFLQKTGNRLVSQPMKGTSPRIASDAERDRELKDALYNSQKDRSENVMVVDLVRNDLSRVCRPGSVQVDELYGIYSYPNVHQMVSTVSGELKDGMGFADVIRACFPMGSMTGAPKHRVMELVEKYEKTRRGLFSGSVGYIDPAGDFDFNVVIRSLLYNASDQCLSFQAGSGITFYSDPEKEWEECLLKARTIKSILEN